MSRQQLWQQKQKAMGLCTMCAKPLFSTVLCRKCLEQRRVKLRARTGCKPWKMGGMGRPPLTPVK